ncbi:MAG: hypothetical protein LUE23_08860 [Lachnospiraceae bacterium]|nr:hypothetical protein [Lachnospiraceae bacterium]
MTQRRILIKDGVLIIPRDYILLRTHGKSTGMSYAGVVEAREGHLGLPHFAFLSHHPIARMTEEEQDAVSAMCQAYVHDRLDGNVKAEWGIFAVHDVTDDDGLYLGTGIVRGVEVENGQET